MATANLSAEPRTETGKGVARKLRQAQRIPAVIYGHHREPMSLSVDGRELERLLAHIVPETTVIELALEGGTARTLIRDIQRHPVRPQILHVDFQELVAGETVFVEVPLVLVGVSPGVRNDGGVLDQVMRELSVEVDPANMPNHIEVDVSSLQLNESIHVSDLKLPEGVKVLADMEDTVCVVAPPRVAEETVAAPEEAEGPEPELIRKTKDEEEADEK
jgi:large subunit ribosomal protein L25